MKIVRGLVVVGLLTAASLAAQPVQAGKLLGGLINTGSDSGNGSGLLSTGNGSIGLGGSNGVSVNLGGALGGGDSGGGSGSGSGGSGGSGGGGLLGGGGSGGLLGGGGSGGGLLGGGGSGGLLGGGGSGGAVGGLLGGGGGSLGVSGLAEVNTNSDGNGTSIGASLLGGGGTNIGLNPLGLLGSGGGINVELPGLGGILGGPGDPGAPGAPGTPGYGSNGYNGYGYNGSNGANGVFIPGNISSRLRMILAMLAARDWITLANGRAICLSSFGKAEVSNILPQKDWSGLNRALPTYAQDIATLRQLLANCRNSSQRQALNVRDLNRVIGIDIGRNGQPVLYML